MVVIDLNDEIVEMVVALQPIAAAIAIQPHRLVVVSAFRILAPGVFRPDRAHRQISTRPRMAIGTPPQLPRPEDAFLGPARALALGGLDGPASKRQRYGVSGRRQPAPLRIACGGADSNRGKRPLAQNSHISS